ncbi:MAG: CGNR zinc finger domain-containing protein [Anaeromyxobacter sp.]
MAYAYTAGDLALDFVNTLEHHDGPVRENVLTSWRELVDWAAGARLLTPRAGEAWRALEQTNPRAAGAVFRRALELRDLLHALVAALVAGRPPAGEDLRRFDALLAESRSAVVLRPSAGALVEDLPVTPGRPASLLDPVITAAARLVTSAETLRLVRRCASATCRQFFVDRSKNRSRRWCDMKLCGNRVKARTFYRRHRGRG